MSPRSNPEQQPQNLFEEDAVNKAQPELEASVLRFWDTVRKSADVIVTLRQENSILQSQVNALRSALKDAEAAAGSDPAAEARIQHLESKVLDLEVAIEMAREETQAALDRATTAEQALASAEPVEIIREVAVTDTAQLEQQHVRHMAEIDALEGRIRGLLERVEALSDNERVLLDRATTAEQALASIEPVEVVREVEVLKEVEIVREVAVVDTTQLEQQRDQYMVEITSLEGRIKGLLERVEALSDNERSLLNRIATLESELRDAREELSTLPSIGEQRPDSDNEELKRSIDRAEDEIKQLMGDLEAREEQIGLLRMAEEEIQRLKAELTQRDVQSSSIIELETEIGQLRDALTRNTTSAMQVKAAEEEVRYLRTELSLRDEQMGLLRAAADEGGELIRQRDAYAASIEDLNTELGQLRQRLSEAEALVQDHTSIAQQLMQVRIELEGRTQLLQELQELQETLLMRSQNEDIQSSVNTQYAADVERITMERDALEARLDELEPVALRFVEAQDKLQGLEDEIRALHDELDRAMAIVEKYRAAGLRHIEDPMMEGQMFLFGGVPAPVASEGIVHAEAILTGDDIMDLADRLDGVAGRLQELFGIR